MAPVVPLNTCILWIAYLLWYDTYKDFATGSTAGPMLHCAATAVVWGQYGQQSGLGGCRVILPIIISRSMAPRNFQ